jgi:hypothetical protein
MVMPGTEILQFAYNVVLDRRTRGCSMNEDAFNASIRKFLKTLGVTAQREIEKAVRQALADGRLKGNEKLPAKATVTIAGVGLTWPVEGEIELG